MSRGGGFVEYFMLGISLDYGAKNSWQKYSIYRYMYLVPTYKKILNDMAWISIRLLSPILALMVSHCSVDLILILMSWRAFESMHGKTPVP